MTQKRSCRDGRDSADGLDPAGKAIRFIGSGNRWSKEANTDSDAETNRGTGQVPVGP